MQTITLNHLSKKFKGSFAVDDITCSFEKGKIYGLLGRNGAGKSTLLRMMSGRLRPSSGEIHYDSSSSLISPYSQAIYHTEPTTLLPEIKIKDIFKQTARFHPAFNLDEAFADAEAFGLNVKKKRRHLSTGQLSILRAVLALNTHRDFLLLDEPTLGFDVVIRELFYEKVLEKFAQDQNTIILSTHLINEISPLLEKVIILDHGRIIGNEDVDNLLSRHYKLYGPKAALASIYQDQKILLQKDQGEFTTLILEGQAQSGKLPLGVAQSGVDLQELFIALTGDAKGVDDHAH